MLQMLTLFLLLFISLEARENPFFPSKGEVDIPYTTNLKSSIPPLKRVTITLPSTARTIESVTVSYKNLDGSIHEKKEELGNSIDWHLPLFISQSYGGVPSEKHKVSHSKNEKFTKIINLKFMTLYESKSSLKIVTKDTLLRDFLLVKPHRIVCDFKRDIDIRSYFKDIKSKGKITKVKVGNHKGYYRVVIELDGYYRYKKSPISGGYSFKLL